MTLSVDARAAGDKVIDDREAELIAKAAAAENMAGTYRDTLSTTQATLAASQTAWAAEKTQLEQTIEALKASQPGPVPVRKSIGTPGKVTNITTIGDANAISGCHIVGPLKFLSGATEADIVDVTADISEGTYTSQVNVIQVDGQAIFGRFKITTITISTANPSPYIAGGIGGQNIIVSDFDISGTVDGFKLNNSDAILSHGFIRNLAQFGPGTVGVQSDGSHTDGIEATSMRSLEVVDVTADIGVRTVAGSHSGLMLLGTVARLRSIGNVWSAAVPWNVVNDITITSLDIAGDRFAQGPVGPYPTSTSAVWAGESIIAKTAARTQIAAALTAGKSTRIDGTPVTIKRG